MLLSDEELRDALFHARVPKVFHRKEATLTKFGDVGNDLAQWVRTVAQADLAEGRGKFLVGNSPEASECFFTLGRSLVTMGFSVKVYSLPMLAKALPTEDFLEEMSGTSALLVAGFYEDHFVDAISQANLYELEWFFRSRWNSDLANIFSASHEISKCSWWSDGFLQEVGRKTDQVIITKPKPPIMARRRLAK